MSVEKLVVSIELGLEILEVGELVSSGPNIYFKYYPLFVERGIEISPFKLPLSLEIQTASPGPFEGLFGVFDDSLPDGWGRLLLDRALLKKGITLSSISVLDRLSFVGNRGKGALSYLPDDDFNLDTPDLLELDKIAQETQKVLAGTSTDVIDELFSWGASSGGARPKILIGYNPVTDHIMSARDNLPQGYEPWIIKFASSSDPEDMAQVEYAYYKMAIDAGIQMHPCKLFTGNSGRKYFGTQRFDRRDQQRIHMHSAAGLMHDNFRLSSMDYGHLMDCAFRLEHHVGAYEKILRLAAFNVFAHNRDDHSKNFSFLMDAQGHWTFAPAYDLTFSRSSHGMHSTTVAGEGTAPGEKQLLELARIYQVKKPGVILEQVREVVSNWKKYAKDSGVGKLTMDMVEKTLKKMVG